MQSAATMHQGLAMAVVIFNKGYRHLASKLFQSLNIPLSDSSQRIFTSIDNKRVSLCKAHVSGDYKRVRAMKRNHKRKKLDAFKKVEGPKLYKSGVAYPS